MRELLVMLAVAVSLVGASPLSMATPADDVRVDTEKDDERNKIFKLVNSGDRPVLAKVEHRKTCSSVSTRYPPEVQVYLVNPGKPVQLRKVWSESSCEHSFRILEAVYREKR